MEPNDFEELLRIQRMMASRIVEESTTDAKIKLYNLISNITTGKKKRIPLEQIIIVAEEEGFTEREVMRILEELKADHMVSEPEEGFIMIA